MIMSSTTKIFLTIALLFSFIAHESTALNYDANDLKALLQAKNSLGNPSELSEWLPDTNYCYWDFIECNEARRVTGIYIFNIDVNANLPSAFGDLSELEILTLQNMPGLTGSIPPSFANLSKLTQFEISNASLSDSIPDFLSMTNLSFLLLNNNKLTGHIPASLSKLPFLQLVDLSHNQLSGSIPPGLLHWEFECLILSNNQLSGEIPESYGQGDVNTIDLSHNNLTGDPSFLFSIDKMTEEIDLSWNQLEFDMTNTAFPLELTYLDLSHNKIRGAVSMSLKDLYILEHMNLTYNQLCGEIPTGGAMVHHDASSYLHNECLCGTPLSACQQ